MAKEIIPADRELRKKVTISLIALCVVAAVGLYIVRGYFRALQEESKDSLALAVDKFSDFALTITGITGLGFTVFAVYMIFAGFRVLVSGEYPAPGVRVIWKTRKHRGKTAQFIGIMQVLLALTLLIATVVSVFYVRYFINSQLF